MLFLEAVENCLVIVVMCQHSCSVLLNEATKNYTGKRSQVVRLVCEPSLLNTLIGYLQNFRKRFSSGDVCWHRLGSLLHVAGLWLRCQVAGYLKLVGRELTCKNQPFILAPHPLGMFCKEEPLQLINRNSILMM